jgi:DNA-binding NarL/FixJ family response regulator
LKNLSDTVIKSLKQEEKQIRSFFEPGFRSAQPQETHSNATETPPEPREKPLAPAEKRRKEQIEITLELASQGWMQKKIALHLGINYKTVQRNLQATSPRYSRHRRGKSLLNDFKPYLQERWKADCHNAAQL